MKRSLIYLLIAIIVAGVLGTLVAQDPGYVLISYGGMSVQTGLWVMLALLATLIAALYWLLRLFRFVGGSASAFRSWRSGRASNRAAKLTARGLMYFQEGDFERAERFLESGADGGNAAVNFIFAARAADKRGKSEQREAWLRRARHADSNAARAVSVASAEMAVARGEYDKALRELESIKAGLQTAILKSRALLGMKDWQALWDLIPELRKAGEPEAEVAALQKRVAEERLKSPAADDDTLAAIYKKLPDAIKRDAEVTLAYCSRLRSETGAEAAIRAALKQDWHPALVSLYGGLGRETLARRIKTAEGWQNQHPDDATLQLCLGELYEANGDKDKAVSSYRRSVELGKLPEAGKHLGRLLAFDGDYKKSNEYLIQALNAK